MRRLARAVGRVALLTGALGMGTLLALQIGPVGRSAFKAAGRLAAPEWLRVEARRVSGSWIGGLSLGGLRVEDTRSGTVVAVDSARVRYHILDLWRPGRLEVDSLILAGVRAAVTRPTGSDGSGPLDAAAESTAARSTLFIGAVGLRRVDASVRVGGGEPFRIEFPRSLAPSKGPRRNRGHLQSCVHRRSLPMASSWSPGSCDTLFFSLPR